jgi:CRP/FNR family transcriptional regulator
VPRLSPEFSEVISRYLVRTYPAGKTIAFQSEIPRFCYIIARGTVRVYSIDSHGEESNITFVSEGNAFPLEYVFDKSRASLYYYEAQTEVDIAVLTAEEFHREIEKDPIFARQVLEHVATQYIGAKIHIQALEQSKAEDKIHRILQFLVVRFGQMLSDEKWKIDLRLTQQDIARMVGVTRETAAAELGKLKKKDIIEYSSFTYTVDMKKLSQLIGSHEWQDIVHGSNQ